MAGRIRNICVGALERLQLEVGRPGFVIDALKAEMTRDVKPQGAAAYGQELKNTQGGPSNLSRFRRLPSLGEPGLQIGGLRSA
jgi:hypothetical protein